MSRIPSRGVDQFMVRFPDGLRDRIKRAAEKNGRSMNAEIISVLEEQYPEPASMEETIADIQESIRILRKFRGETLLNHLADQLDYLMIDLSRLPDEASAEAKAHLDENTRFPRFTPPSED